MAKPTIRVVAAMITRPRVTDAITVGPGPGNGNGGGASRVTPVVVEAAEKEYLITQRRPEAVLPLKWEFPGGKVELDEQDAAALLREMRERLGVDVQVGELISQVNHQYADYEIDLRLYEATIDPLAELRPRAVHAFRWVTSREFDGLEFAAADEASLARLLGLRPGRGKN